MKRILFSFLLLFVAIASASAFCPVCTVAVGAGLEGARLLKIDDVIVGIWAGALTLSLFFWTVGWLKKRNVKSLFWQIIVPFVVYYGLLACVYAIPGINFGEFTMFGIDKLLLGIIVGTISFYLGIRWYAKIKRENGGRAKYAFQKVVVPICFLLIVTAFFAAIIYL
ncbi:MAG: hypothetical protein ACOX7D_01850 [Alphaproteobacteria bacterium]